MWMKKSGSFFDESGEKPSGRDFFLSPKSICFFFLLTSLTLIPNKIDAVGFRLPNQDPEGIARGNAFVATADNPSAIYYNPAGITQLEGQQFRAGLYVISGDTEYTSPLTGAK